MFAPSRPHALRHAALAAAAVLAAPLPLIAQQSSAPDPHAGHAAHAPSVDARGELSVRPVRGDAAPMERQELEVRLRLTDGATGRPLTGLDPMAWVDVHAVEGDTPLEICREKVGGFAEAGMHIKHGQISIVQPVEDLNGHYVLALARQPFVAVLDPVKGFGRTRMYTAVPLRAPGADWAATPDERRLFVALPDVDEVAVVNTHSWRVEASVPVAGRPSRTAVQPDGRLLWVASEAGGVTAVDTRTHEVRAAFRAGAGPHALAFSSDGRWTFVASAGAGTLTVIDGRTMRAADVATGPRPVDVQWSDARGAAFVAHEGDGSVVLVDPATGAAVDRIAFQPGLARFVFAPEGGHGAHTGDHEAPRAGRLGFAVNPRAGTVDIVDVVAGRRVRTLGGAPEPDAVGFSPGFAYVRAAGTANVAMIPLSDPTQGATGPHDYFPAGSADPGSVAGAPGAVVVPSPGGHDAVYVVNPAERMIYSYHYMEGMPVPHGGLTTYQFEPRAIRTVSRRVRETEPGVYAATFSVDAPGRFDLIFRNADPGVLGCYAFDVRPDPALRTAEAFRITPEVPSRALAVGANTLRFRVHDVRGDRPVDDVADLQVQFAATTGARSRVPARPVGGGLYEAVVTIEEAGVYYVSFESARLSTTYRDRSPLTYAAGDGR